MGSSPLTRGKRGASRAEDDFDGLIPAHAGKTPGSRSTGLSAWAHPRSRGENAPVADLGDAPQGSSPLTRGKQPAEKLRRAPWGLIPAHAGKTPARRGPPPESRAHPRSRGENAAANCAQSIWYGSSPLTRGKPSTDQGLIMAIGLIPAHAGKTWGQYPHTSRPGAHPRSRGENSCESLIVSWVGGSSPLTRGKRRSVSFDLHTRGLIPAHAGKTLPDLRFYRADRSDLGKP